MFKNLKFMGFFRCLCCVSEDSITEDAKEPQPQLQPQPQPQPQIEPRKRLSRKTKVHIEDM